MQGLYAVRLGGRGKIAPELIFFHPMITEKSFLASKYIYTAPYGIFIAKSPPRLAPEWSFVLVEISHLIMDFVVSPASNRIFRS